MKSKIRKYQDQIRDKGWRITWIPHERHNRTIMVKGNPLTVLGVVCFIAGLGLLVATRNKMWVFLAIGAMVLMGTSLLFAARNKRKNWVKVRSHCIDREIAKGVGRTGRLVWSFRILCDFEYAGTRYQVTPTHWVSFNHEPFSSDEGENAVEKELTRVVDADGMCWLYVNPENPLQAEIAGDDIKDKLLHG